MNRKERVGKRIKTIRLELGYNMREFGEKISKDNPPSNSIVSRWEKGISLPSAGRLKAIAELGNTTVNHLLFYKTKEEIQLDVYKMFFEEIESKSKKIEEYEIKNLVKSYKRTLEELENE